MTRSIYNMFANSRFGSKRKYQKDPKSATSTETTAVKDEPEVPMSKFSLFARRVEQFMLGGSWTIISVICTITSLLAYDFTIAFLPKSVDISTDIILLVVFIFFFVELIVASLFRKGYFLSFWFWLDFIAMISMIPDLALLLELFGSGESELNLANTQASKAGKSGRSTAALKGVRMIRFSRLLRVLRVFKFFQTEDDADDAESDPVDVGSSKVGQIVSEAVTKKVIVLVLVLVLALPWMDPSGASFTQSATTASLLFRQCLDNGISTDEALPMFSTVGVPILEIYIDGEVVESDPDTLTARRPVEVWELTLGQDDYIKFDIRGNVMEEVSLGMCLTMFAIVVFASSALFVTASTMNLVVAPIARLTELLTNMAGVIGLLGGAQTVENLMETHDEMFIVEALCERIMDIFGTGGHAQSPSKIQRKKGGKALSMMASRKVTQITSGDRIWEIDVKEKHRTSVIERRVHRAFRDFVDCEAVLLDIDEEEEEELAELKTLRAIVDNPTTLYCLRMFMTSNLSINNLLFVLEADEWKKGRKSKFDALYEKYCDEESLQQINLDAQMFAGIRNVYEGLTPLSEDVFEKAIVETWELMEKNIYLQFLESDHCKFYLYMKDADPLTLNQLQMSIPEAIEEADGQCIKQIIRNSETTESRELRMEK